MAWESRPVFISSTFSDMQAERDHLRNHVFPDLSRELVNAIMDALAAHSTMSAQALSSQKVQDGLKDILLGPAELYEALRARAAST